MVADGLIRFGIWLVPLPISVEHERGGGLAGRAGDLLGAWEIEFFSWCDRAFTPRREGAEVGPEGRVGLG
jgi:hypothetical protein